MGGDLPVLVQSMTNTPTADVEATVVQIKQLILAGCDIVRVTVSTLKEVESFGIIRKQLHDQNIDVPLVADVHYSPKVAEMVAVIADKVRINPGNYVTDKIKERYSEQDFIASRLQIAKNIQPLVEVCKKHKTSIRIGVNLGSLSKRILYRYGNTAKGMVESALEFMGVLLDTGFHQFTLSLKASNVRIMQEANVMLVKEMIKKNIYFPLHLGVTEAGSGMDARIKSAAGIGALLQLGIGNTIRVSLTENPEAEIPVAKKLLKFVNNKGVSISEIDTLHFHAVPIDQKLSNQSGPLVIASQADSRADYSTQNGKLVSTKENNVINSKDLNIFTFENDEADFENFIFNATTSFAAAFLKHPPQAFYLKNRYFNSSILTKCTLDILQGLGLRYSKTEYIACPSCGRTRFDIMEKLKQVKEKTSSFKGLKIAVMGCVVNGPGEMADANYGFVGSGKGKITLYRAGKAVIKQIPEAEAVEALLELIKSDNQP
ncbi:MAG: 4-hydroxy-3-methylbut-2-en-1-yl diphosphate synthase [Bacteroidetes bacterium]|nr:MAG: 4-hydroxy-3-methylbut-2-en-1-yl diphosphate synthase [Bacteroidota bacterium]